MGTADQIRLPCLIFQQKDETIYQFNMNADQFELLARVEHFGESSEGVNRKRDTRHAQDIANDMISDDDVLMLDVVAGDLVGDWRYESGYLVPGPDAFLSIDDGQHRDIVMTELLPPEERAKWTLGVHATKGLSVERRMRIFRQQRRRKPIDSKLDLAMRWKLDDWRNPQEREAYRLLLQLNSDPSSPLQGLIILDETIVRTYEHQHRPEGINAAGLHPVIVSAMSKKSPLYSMGVDKRVDVIRDLIFAAAETWPEAWRSSEHVLCTSKGVQALIRLINSKDFQLACSNVYTPESLRQTLSLANKRFSWRKEKWSRIHPKEISENLAAAIGSGVLKSLGDAVA